MDKKLNYTFSVCTLGCKVNQYESDCIASKLISYGLEQKKFDEICDIYIINTCVVTFNSEKKSCQMIRRAKKLNQSAIIAVCGCYSQLYGSEHLKNLPYDILYGNTKKESIADKIIETITEKNQKIIQVSDIKTVRIYENIRTYKSERTRANIKIEDGCGHNCTYCIIPTVRGPVRSRGYSEIYNEIKYFNDIGYHEIVLTGIEISSYGNDFGDTSLIMLLERLNSEKELGNIISVRLGSLDPSYLRKNFIDRFVNLEKLCRHFHLSLQSGSDKILNLMKRCYNSSMIYDYMSYAKSQINELILTADMITGFPGEEDEDNLKSLEMMEKLGLYHTHIFTYSKRPGTPAEKFSGQVDENVKNKRSRLLDEINRKLKEKILNENLGKEFDIICENFDNDYYNGKTKNYIDVKIEKETEYFKPNDIIKVKSFSYDENSLICKKI